MHGSEVDAAAAAQVRLQTKMLALNNEMQMRISVAQTILQQQVQSQQGETSMAQTADTFCWGGILVGSIAQAFQSSDTSGTARDVADVAGKVAGAGCAVGREIRKGLTQQQYELSQGLLTMASAGFDSHRYNQDEASTLVDYAKSLPREGLAEIMDGVDPANTAVTRNPALGDRIMVYYRTHDSARSQAQGISP